MREPQGKLMEIEHNRLHMQIQSLQSDQLSQEASFEQDAIQNHMKNTVNKFAVGFISLCAGSFCSAISTNQTWKNVGTFVVVLGTLQVFYTAITHGINYPQETENRAISARSTNLSNSLPSAGRTHVRPRPWSSEHKIYLSEGKYTAHKSPERASEGKDSIDPLEMVPLLDDAVV